jgi:hypothetical protein
VVIGTSRIIPRGTVQPPRKTSEVNATGVQNKQRSVTTFTALPMKLAKYSSIQSTQNPAEQTNIVVA